MYFKNAIRFLNVGSRFYATDKSALATLRKKTGYTFANCKKALELHNNDIIKAEDWLQEQAQSMGWSKATKLEGRVTTQGLVGVLLQNNVGTMVEVNCETDFVARNHTFQQFVDIASLACVKYVNDIETTDSITRIKIESDSLKKIMMPDGKTLGDHLALMIGTVGENAILKRALCFKTCDTVHMAAYTHPSTGQKPNSTLLGKYGSIIAYRTNNELSSEFKKNICQHIVGMNPLKIGKKDFDEPATNKDDEICLIHQEYLLNPDQTAGEVLEANNIELLDFERFECGESVKIEENVTVEKKAIN